MWYSGNKSYHVHCLLDLKNAVNKQLLKKTFIRHYTTGLPVPDLRLCASNHLIRAEYGLHEKTGNKKALIEKHQDYPKVVDIPDLVWKEYMVEIRNSINRRVLYRARNLSDLPGFKYIVSSHDFKESDDGRERALFMLIHLLKQDYVNDRPGLIKFLQDWYRYSAGYKLTPEQIRKKINYHWSRNYCITENYLNELLESVGRGDLIEKDT